MNLEKALTIIDDKFFVPLHTLKLEYRNLARRAAEEMFANVGRADGSGPLRLKDKLNEWINAKADQYLHGYYETIPQADIDDFEALEKRLHTHFLKAMDGYYSEACHTLAGNGQAAYTMHLHPDYESMKRGKLADISLLVAKLRKSTMHHTQSNVTYNLSGANARVLIGSQDYSINVANSKIFFEQVRQAVEKIDNPELKQQVLGEVAGMEATVGKPAEYLPRYTKFISLIANHASLFANIIPALTEFLKPVA